MSPDFAPTSQTRGSNYNKVYMLMQEDIDYEYFLTIDENLRVRSSIL